MQAADEVNKMNKKMEAFNFSGAEIETLISSVEKAKPYYLVSFQLRSLTKTKTGVAENVSFHQ